MFSKIGAGELIIILVIALLIFGPNKLPEIGKTLGKGVNSIKKYLHSATSELKEAVGDFDEIENDIKEIRTDVKSTIDEALKTEPEVDGKIIKVEAKKEI